LVYVTVISTIQR